jgi:acyl-CoA synthetase (AMP-forming)/AMP-acid ligase II
MEDVYAKKPWLKFYDPGVPAALTYPKISMGQALKASCDKYPDRAAILHMGTAITYGQLDELSNRFAQFLLKLGCKPGDVVGWHSPNFPACLIAEVGIHKAGCVYSGVSPLFTPEELEYQLQDAAAKVLITTDGTMPLVSKIAGNTGLKAVLVTAPTEYVRNAPAPTAELPNIPGVIVKRFQPALMEMPADPVLIPVKPDDPCLMMYTGGTTGLPKGAVLTQSNVLANMTQANAWYQFQQGGEILLTAFPLFHSAGNTVGLLALFAGASYIVVVNPRDFQGLINDLKQYKPTYFGHVPTVFLELMKLQEFRSLDFSGVRYFMVGASPYPAENIKDLESVIGENMLMEGYGMTELTTFGFINPYKGRKKIGSVGIPISDTEAKIVDPDTDEPMPVGEEGEIIVKGPQMMKEYFNKPEETEHAKRGGWMHTGDLGKMDEDGYFYVVDRLKDMISVSGLKVFSRVVDDVLAEHPAVAMGATIGVPDISRPGSEIVACAVVLKPGNDKNDAMKEDIIKYCRERLSPYKVPKIITFMDALPTSAVGKILKRELRKMITA